MMDPRCRLGMETAGGGGRLNYNSRQITGYTRAGALLVLGRTAAGADLEASGSCQGQGKRPRGRVLDLMRGLFMKDGREGGFKDGFGPKVTN
jgi:hypothetical protein